MLIMVCFQYVVIILFNQVRPSLPILHSTQAYTENRAAYKVIPDQPHLISYYLVSVLPFLHMEFESILPKPVVSSAVLT